MGLNKYFHCFHIFHYILKERPFLEINVYIVYNKLTRILHNYDTQAFERSCLDSFLLFYMSYMIFCKIKYRISNVVLTYRNVFKGRRWDNRQKLKVYILKIDYIYIFQTIFYSS